MLQITKLAFNPFADELSKSSRWNLIRSCRSPDLWASNEKSQMDVWQIRIKHKWLQIKWEKEQTMQFLEFAILCNNQTFWLDDGFITKLRELHIVHAFPMKCWSVFQPLYMASTPPLRRVSCTVIVYWIIRTLGFKRDPRVFKRPLSPRHKKKKKNGNNSKALHCVHMD